MPGFTIACPGKLKAFLFTLLFLISISLPAFVLYANAGKKYDENSKIFKLIRESFVELALQLKTDSRMSGVMAVGGVMPLFFGGDNYPAEKVFTRLGLYVTPFKGPMGFGGRPGKQIHSWMMMWAYNPKGLQNRNLFELRWADCWMTTDEFIRLYANAKSRDSQLNSDT